MGANEQYTYDIAAHAAPIYSTQFEPASSRSENVRLRHPCLRYCYCAD